MAFLDVTYFENDTRRQSRMELGDRRVLVDEAQPERRFRLSRAVRGGGNGVVFEADKIAPDGRFQGVCAVKLLRQLDVTSVDRFVNERRILTDLAHPSIAAFYGAGTIRSTANPDVPWMAMDLGGDNLRSHVHDHGPLPAPTLRRVGLQICDAVQYIHERDLIHRDLKPANIVWTGDGSSHDVKLIDFGLAKRTGEDVSGRPLDDFTRTREFVGPVFYSSPELIAYADNKTCPVDHRSDLFQLGKVLWYLATGRTLAGIPSVRQDPTGGRLLQVVVDLIAEDPNDRPDSANVVRARIEEW